MNTICKAKALVDRERTEKEKEIERQRYITLVEHPKVQTYFVVWEEHGTFHSLGAALYSPPLLKNKVQ